VDTNFRKLFQGQVFNQKICYYLCDIHYVSYNNNNNNNNNNHENIYIARTLKKTSDALIAHSQTNNVLVYVRMYAVTERGVVGRQVDCSILWLQ